MSASTQTGEATQTRTNGNGHVTRGTRKARGPNKAKAKAKAPAAGMPQGATQGVTGAAAQTATAPIVARIGPTAIPVTGGMLSVAYLRDRLTRLDIERQVIQSLISAAPARTAISAAAPRKAKTKRAKRKAAPVRQAA